MKSALGRRKTGGTSDREVFQLGVSVSMIPQRLQLAFFASTIFVSAFLLFQVQPLISKFILPWFGGSPSVWTTAMLFFQSTLCAGYLYAYLLTRRLSPISQVQVHLVLLFVASFMAAFIAPEASMKPVGNEQPAFKILLLLATCVGLPYFCLATTGPLIQYWFARAASGASAFRLYALSNTGSLLALLSFPYLFEPAFTIQRLAEMWSNGFWVFALLCAYTAWMSRHSNWQPHASAHGLGDSMAEGITEIPTLFQRVQWVLLPALASLAFIATTDHVSHDIAPEPRLWVTTLSLYLLTFIISFDHPRWYQRRWIALLCGVAILGLSGRYDVPEWLGIDVNYSLGETRWGHFTTMFLICFLCHGELYRLRPTNPRFLTEFYLMMSIGGALGGLFVALIATNLFADYYEWTLLLMTALWLAGNIFRGERLDRHSTPPSAAPSKPLRLVVATLLCGLIFFWEDPLALRNRNTDEYQSKVVHQARNFYGAVAVVERRYFKHPELDRRIFYSGQIVHGVQLLQADRRRLNGTYYSEESGVGETLSYAMLHKSSLKVAIVGLGAGTLANYARANDEYDFYEINPEVIHVANTWFDNVSNCKAAVKQTYLGDARLKFENLASDKRYDVIVLDAFSGDSVPLHLLTKEAFALYERHLAPDGFIAVHITNSYLNLYPVVKRQAEALRMEYRNKQQPEDMDREIRRNHYFILTRDQAYLSQYPSFNKRYDDKGEYLGESAPDLPNVPLWSDNFSSIGPIQLKD